jgi:tRNA 2-thiouridine synthesizing protein A
MPSTTSPAYDAAADTAELGCGELMLALRKAVLPLAPGAVLRLKTADPGAAEDIPAWCRLTGHRLLAADAEAGLYYIRKREVEG